MWTAFPSSDYYGGSVPSPGHRLTASLSRGQAGCLAGGGARGGSRVHHVPIDGGGAQLFSGGLAMGTPQAFPMASSSTRMIDFEVGVASPRRRAPLTDPCPPGLGSVRALRRFHHWFLRSYTFPSRLPSPGCLAVPACLVVVRAAPARPCASRVRLPSASPACCDRSGAGPLIPLGLVAPRGARPPAGSTSGRASPRRTRSSGQCSCRVLLLCAAIVPSDLRRSRLHSGETTKPVTAGSGQAIERRSKVCQWGSRFGLKSRKFCSITS